MTVNQAFRIVAMVCMSILAITLFYVGNTFSGLIVLLILIATLTYTIRRQVRK